MATRLVHVVIDTANPLSLANFWGQALGWQVTIEEPDEVVASPEGFEYPGTSALPLVFVSVPDPKAGKNRVHLDLASTSPQDQAAQVERLLGIGATRVDIGQGQVPWEVLADPEGNEFCVLELRPSYRDTGPVAAIVVDCADPASMASFWTRAAGWDVTRTEGDLIGLRSHAGQGPYLEMLASKDPKLVKNRVHLDVAPFVSSGVEAEVARLREAGATPVDVGQGEQDWVVLADLDGQEFCVLTPR